MIEFLKWLFGYNKNEDFDEDGSEFLTFIVDSDFRAEPCKGSLNIGTHCRGCTFEEEHTKK